ncbi:uncharacterized protein [Gorilla gorilla gorilla]|uniref:uncharacterized protein n=1 Tax=Gorilla gorilla gorilla TaxID=9595 RepID=UPI00300A1CA4
MAVASVRTRAWETQCGAAGSCFGPRPPAQADLGGLVSGFPRGPPNQDSSKPEPKRARSWDPSLLVPPPPLELPGPQLCTAPALQPSPGCAPGRPRGHFTLLCSHTHTLDPGHTSQGRAGKGTPQMSLSRIPSTCRGKDPTGSDFTNLEQGREAKF